MKLAGTGTGMDGDQREILVATVGSWQAASGGVETANSLSTFETSPSFHSRPTAFLCPLLSSPRCPWLQQRPPLPRRSSSPQVSSFVAI